MPEESGSAEVLHISLFLGTIDFCNNFTFLLLFWRGKSERNSELRRKNIMKPLVIASMLLRSRHICNGYLCQPAFFVAKSQANHIGYHATEWKINKQKSCLPVTDCPCCQRWSRQRHLAHAAQCPHEGGLDAAQDASGKIHHSEQTGLLQGEKRPLHVTQQKGQASAVMAR